MKTCSGMTLASLIGWLLLMPPFSVTPAGKSFVDAKASLASWEVFSKHASEAECQKHRDQLRAQLEKAAGSKDKSGKSKQVFANLKERAAAALCLSSDDPRLRPAATPATTPTGHPTSAPQPTRKPAK